MNEIETSKNEVIFEEYETNSEYVSTKRFNVHTNDSNDLVPRSRNYSLLMSSDCNYLYAYGGYNTLCSTWRYNLLTQKWKLIKHKIQGTFFEIKDYIISKEETASIITDSSNYKCEFIYFDILQYQTKIFFIRFDKFTNNIIMNSVDLATNIYHDPNSNYMADSRQYTNYPDIYEMTTACPEEDDFYNFEEITMYPVRYSYDSKSNMYKPEMLLFDSSNQQNLTYKSEMRAKVLSYWETQPHELKELAWRVENSVEEFYSKPMFFYKGSIFMANFTSGEVATFRQFFVFNVETRQFSIINLNPDPDHGYPADRLVEFVKHNDYYYIIGGEKLPMDYDDVWRLNMQSLQWQSFSQRLPFKLKNYSAAVADEFIYVFGGKVNVGLTTKHRKKSNQEKAENENFAHIIVRRCQESDILKRSESKEWVSVNFESIYDNWYGMTRIRIGISSLHRICAEVVLTTFKDHPELKNAINSANKTSSEVEESLECSAARFCLTDLCKSAIAMARILQNRK